MTVEYQKVWTTMNDLEMVTSKICSAREIIDNAIDKIQGNEYDKAELLMTAAYEFLEYYLQEFDDKFKLAWQATVGDLRDGDNFQYTATGEKWSLDEVLQERDYYEGKAPLSCDKDDPSPECKGAWNSFWEENYYPEESQQYTEEELNAMCDKAFSDEEKEKCREYNLREAEYYDKRVKLNAELEQIRKDGGFEWTPEPQKTLSYDEAIAAGWEMTADGFWIKGQKPQKQTVQTRWILPVQEAKDMDTDETEYFVAFPQDLLDTADLKEGDAIHWIDNNDGSYTIRKSIKPLGPDEC